MDIFRTSYLRTTYITIIINFELAVVLVSDGNEHAGSNLMRAERKYNEERGRHSNKTFDE